MITQLDLVNFKCFDSLSLPISSLTLLTGFNAAGKSSSLQGLLLLAQSLQSDNHSSVISLNGRLTHLGTPREVVSSGDGAIIFRVRNDDASIEWSLRPEDRTNGSSMKIQRIELQNGSETEVYLSPVNTSMLFEQNKLQGCKRIVDDLRSVIYLGAVHTGTEDIFPIPEGVSQAYADVGIHGEYAPWWFYQLMDEDIDPNRCNNSDNAKTLRRQLNAWISELFPGAQANVQIVEKTNFVRLEFRNNDTSDWRRPSNIGYGLTYAFPILVAGLIAKPNQIIVIDSPESHLHPHGQSMMGLFLSKMASTGVQIVIETHSDHIVNGVRLAVKGKIISQDNISILFFSNSEHGERIGKNIVTPQIDNNGNISEWPDGFGDQTDKDLAVLAGWI